MDINDFIRRLDIKTFIEIGVHFGSDTKQFRRFHPDARIIGFEPDPRNVKMLQDTGIDKLIELFPCALSDMNGVFPFHLSGGRAHSYDPQFANNDWSASSSLKVPTGHLKENPWCTFDRTVNVITMRLDDIHTIKNTTIDFIWADVQGAEDLVFSGAQETLKRTRYVYTEYSPGIYEGALDKDGLLQLFKGWEVVHDYGGDILLKNLNPIILPL
jgi:FkbM family methyltransferase